MKRKLLFLFSTFLVLSYFPNDSKGLQYASTTWTKFKNASELIVKVRVIKAEINSGGYTLTCEIKETFKGQKLKRVTFSENLMHFNPIRINEQGIVALKKQNSKWKLAVSGRSYWPIRYEMKPNSTYLVRVNVNDHLIRDFPRSLKKTVTVKTLLVNRKYHQYSTKVYLLSDIEKFLRSQF